MGWGGVCIVNIKNQSNSGKGLLPELLEPGSEGEAAEVQR